MKLLTFPAGALIDKQLRVGLIGSCRLLGPFDNSLLLDSWVTGYTHTFGEAIQKYKWMLNQIIFPVEIQPYIFDQNQPTYNPKWRELCSNLDVVLIEVSSLQEICHEEYRFQLNYFYRNFVSHYGPSLSNWYRNFSLGKDITPEDLDKVKSSFNDLSEAEINWMIKVLCRTNVKNTNTFDLISLFESNKDLFPANTKFGLITHFTFHDANSSLIQSRAKLIEEVKNAGKALKVEVYDPSDLIKKHKSEDVLAKNGKDVNHYASEFYPTMLIEYQNFLKKILA